MIGGIITDVEISIDRVKVTVRDKPPYRDVAVRSMPLTPKTRCLGAGDSLWWQGDVHYWTPQGSMRLDSGNDCDIRVTGSGS